MAVSPKFWTVGAVGDCFRGFERIGRNYAGFWWDWMDGATVVFLANDEETSAAYSELAEWSWTSSLIAPDFALIHESIFE